MRDLDEVAWANGSEPGRVRLRFADQTVRLIRRVAHTLEAPREIGAGLLSAAKALPLLVDRTPDVADHALGLVPRARQQVSGLRARRLEFGLGAAEEPGALGLAALDRRRALRVPPVAIVQARQELLELALLRRAIAMSPLDQRRRQAEPRPDGERIALSRAIIDEAERRREPLVVELDRG